jgi:4-carboxymuconolactone decarboxylase
MTLKRIQVAIVIAVLLGVGGSQRPASTALAQAPAAQREEPPSLAQLRETVSRLRGNRIATPNNYDTLSAAQKQYVASILSGPRADISGPLGVMMVSPELGDLAQKAMAYSRFAGREGFSSVPPKLNELAILVVAKHWSAEYVWNAHHNAAVRFGVPAEVVEAIRVGKRPAAMEKDVEVIYDFATEFMSKRALSDASVNAAKQVLGGDRGVVDLVGTMGLYQISSMMVALDKTPVGEGGKSFFQ